MAEARTKKRALAGEHGLGSGPPIKLKNGIAILDPSPIGRGAFGEIYTGKILNPIGLLAERVVRGEEHPRWLGLDDLHGAAEPDASGARAWLPQPITDASARRQIAQAAERLWNEYLGRRLQDPKRAAEEFHDLLSLLDPLLLQDATIAVKVLVPPTDQNPDLESRIVADSVRRFIKENDMLRELQHPGIVRRLGLVEDPHMGWCLLLEFIEGETLDESVRRHEGRRMPLAAAALRAREIADALQYIHGKGIIHRDLKPSNVMVRQDDGRAVIMDFGIGKWSNEARTQQLTIPGARVGTPRYMAPEQVRADGVVSPATDVYQLSTLLFEMVAGRPAYDGMDQTDIFHWLADRGSRHPVYVADFLPGIPRRFEALIEVGRDKDPDNRWTIEEFRARLDEIIAGGDADEAGPGPTPAELEEALRRTRIVKKQALWDEHALETRLHHAQLEARIEDTRRRIRQGAHAEARALAQGLGKEALFLPPRYDALKGEIEGLLQEVDLATARLEAEQLLARAEEEAAAQRFLDLGERLEGIGRRLEGLPAGECGEIRERYRLLSERFEGQHRSFVELFCTLRRSFISKIQQRTGDLERRHRSGGEVEPAVLRDLLEQVTMAENNLKIIDRYKIGPAAWDRARKDLDAERLALEGLLRKMAVE